MSVLWALGLILIHRWQGRPGLSQLWVSSQIPCVSIQGVLGAEGGLFVMARFAAALGDGEREI